MKTQITKSYNGNIKKTIFTTDSLHRYYDFKDDKVGEVIFDRDLIYSLYYKELRSVDEIEKAEKLIEFIKPLNVNNKQNFNFIVSWNEGKIILEIGYRCAYIKAQLEDYIKYLDDLKMNGMEIRIEFIEENEDKREE